MSKVAKNGATKSFKIKAAKELKLPSVHSGQKELQILTMAITIYYDIGMVVL